MAKAKKLPEIKLTATSPLSTSPENCDAAIARWSDDDGNRYHAQLTKVGPQWHIDSSYRTDGPTLYKNPPAVVDRYSSGYFRTRHLNAEAAAHRAVAEEVLRLANQTSAIQDSAEARRAEREREEAEERRKDALAVREAFNQALFASLLAGEINREKYAALSALTSDFPDQSWLTLGRAVRRA